MLRRMKGQKLMINQKKIAILDDYFPNLTTGFRISEFNYYLEKYPNCEVYATRYDMHHHEYAAVYPQYKDKVKPFTQFDWTGQSYALYYMVFLSNAAAFHFVYEMFNTPFIFELYPGGGFWINDDEIDARLIKVLQSPLLRKVIVTQKRTYDYITSRGFVTPDKIAYIYGMVTYPEYFHSTVPKRFYGKDKNTLDICFVAHKYMPTGMDKGYPIFIEMCKKLASITEDIRFHVVGNFDRDEIDVSELGSRIVFYGLRDKSFFPQFFSGMDMIVSPNLPFVLIPGKNFDGFPTGCCIDAALHNVAVFCTDELNMNDHFEHKKDLFIIHADAGKIAESIMEYYQSPEKLYSMSACGQAKFREIFDFEKQMRDRVSVIEQYV
ncbi:MAG: glycosyltransferase family 4 protein [Dehalobacter sp.]|uniref:LPS biosynthesis protein RfbU n=3 Tax=Desulfitobacteriaceae TaxID=2937909 RepID=A0A857DMC9_9FIRM|nr:glycosyltransferase family 4 protein [Dehalobacter sp.]OCZ52105.1 LPS biosynthesis protein [Dehalobacter sp. TeCB1]QHA01871.1 LPS biosynthesis protein RfbU [Dehalobacter restrictus]